MYPHRIRLRGPWECEPMRSVPGTVLPAPRRMILPCRWHDGGLLDFAGQVRFRRRFGYPGQIDAVERVWLTCAGVVGTVQVTLNQQSLGVHPTNSPFEHEVGALLLPRNELLLDVEAERHGGVAGEVALEVRRTAFLRACHVGLDSSRWHARGELHGDAEGDLELYLIVGRRTIAYRTIQVHGSAVAFELHGDMIEPATVARLELVQGAVVWFGVDVPVT